MTNLDDTRDRTRQRVLDAAVEELLVTSVGSFTMDKVAVRAGVGVEAIMRIWPNTPELFAAAMRSWADRHIPIPDTGTLAGDLLGFARSYSATVNSAVGRRLLDALIVKRTDWELSDSRSTFLQGRESRIGVIIARAIRRGDCPAGTDPTLTIDLLGIGLCLPVLIYDQPITDEHCRYVVATLLHGIAGKH